MDKCVNSAAGDLQQQTEQDSSITNNRNRIEEAEVAKAGAAIDRLNRTSTIASRKEESEKHQQEQKLQEQQKKQ